MGMPTLPIPINEATLTVVAAIVAALVVWTLLKVVARLIAAAIIVGLLLAGVALLVGRMSGQPPAAVVQSAVATVAAEATRMTGDVTGRDGFGRLDRMGLTPTPRP